MTVQENWAEMSELMKTDPEVFAHPPWIAEIAVNFIVGRRIELASDG